MMLSEILLKYISNIYSIFVFCIVYSLNIYSSASITSLILYFFHKHKYFIIVCIQKKKSHFQASDMLVIMIDISCLSICDFCFWETLCARIEHLAGEMNSLKMIKRPTYKHLRHHPPCFLCKLYFSQLSYFL